MAISSDFLDYLNFSYKTYDYSYSDPGCSSEVFDLNEKFKINDIEFQLKYKIYYYSENWYDKQVAELQYQISNTNQWSFYYNSKEFKEFASNKLKELSTLQYKKEYCAFVGIPIILFEFENKEYQFQFCYSKTIYSITHNHNDHDRYQSYKEFLNFDENLIKELKNKYVMNQLNLKKRFLKKYLNYNLKKSVGDVITLQNKTEIKVKSLIKYKDVYYIVLGEKFDFDSNTLRIDVVNLISYFDSISENVEIQSTNYLSLNSKIINSISVVDSIKLKKLFDEILQAQLS